MFSVTVGRSPGAVPAVPSNLGVAVCFSELPRRERYRRRCRVDRERHFVAFSRRVAERAFLRGHGRVAAACEAGLIAGAPCAPAPRRRGAGNFRVPGVEDFHDDELGVAGGSAERRFGVVRRRGRLVEHDGGRARVDRERHGIAVAFAAFIGLARLGRVDAVREGFARTGRPRHSERQSRRQGLPKRAGFDCGARVDRHRHRVEFVACAAAEGRCSVVARRGNAFQADLRFCVGSRDRTQSSGADAGNSEASQDACPSPDRGAASSHPALSPWRQGVPRRVAVYLHSKAGPPFRRYR